MSEAKVASVQAKCQNIPPLACRLRLTEVMGRQGPVPNMGEMELENCSDAPLAHDLRFFLPLRLTERPRATPG